MSSTTFNMALYTQNNTLQAIFYERDDEKYRKRYDLVYNIRKYDSIRRALLSNTGMISSTTCPFFFSKADMKKKQTARKFIYNSIRSVDFYFLYMSWKPTIKFDCCGSYVPFCWPLGLAKSCNSCIVFYFNAENIYISHASILTNACLNTTNGMNIYHEAPPTRCHSLRTCVLHIQYERVACRKHQPFAY